MPAIPSSLRLLAPMIPLTLLAAPAMAQTSRTQDNAVTSADDAFGSLTLVMGGGFSAPGQLRFAGGVLYGNTDLDADAEFAIALTGVTTLSLQDLVA